MAQKDCDSASPGLLVIRFDFQRKINRDEVNYPFKTNTE